MTDFMYVQMSLPTHIYHRLVDGDELLLGDVVNVSPTLRQGSKQHVKEHKEISITESVHLYSVVEDNTGDTGYTECSFYLTGMHSGIQSVTRTLSALFGGSKITLFVAYYWGEKFGTCSYYNFYSGVITDRRMVELYNLEPVADEFIAKYDNKTHKEEFMSDVYPGDFGYLNSLVSSLFHDKTLGQCVGAVDKIYDDFGKQVSITLPEIDKSIQKRALNMLLADLNNELNNNDNAFGLTTGHLFILSSVADITVTSLHTPTVISGLTLNPDKVIDALKKGLTPDKE